MTHSLHQGEAGAALPHVLSYLAFALIDFADFGGARSLGKSSFNSSVSDGFSTLTHGGAS